MSEYLSYSDASTTKTPGPKNLGKKLLFLISEASYFLSHRLSLAQAAQKAGYQVHVATTPSKLTLEIQEKGFEHHSLHKLHRSRLNPFQDLSTIRELFTLYQRIQPDIAHHVAMKPTLYGSFVAKKTGVPKVINAFGGLGYLFSSSSLKARSLRSAIRLPMRTALNQPESLLVLQNKDDHELLVKKGFLARDNVVLIPGSGVDTTCFSPKKIIDSPTNKSLMITYVGRLLWDKGLQELCEAAALVKECIPLSEVHLYGDIDSKNPCSLTTKEIDHLERHYPVRFRGPTQDVASVYQASDIAVLPSYREGLPKSLLEAASSGLPIVTTDVPGCRDVVEDNVSGFLVPPKKTAELATALIRLCQKASLRQAMGYAGRSRALTLFAQDLINKQTLALYEEPTNPVLKRAT